MLNRPQEILFVTNEGAVQKNGFSATLGKGQFGIVDKGAAKSALGEKVTDKGYIKVSGCGMDMVFSLKYQTLLSFENMGFLKKGEALKLAGKRG